MATDIQEGSVIETKETDTDTETTIEYQDLKAKTKYKDKKDKENTETYNDPTLWEISSNGDKIKDHRASRDGVKEELRYMYKRGKERTGK